MHKIILSVSFVLLSFQITNAQESTTKDSMDTNGSEFKDRFFQCTGGTAFLDYDVTPLRDISYTRSTYFSSTNTYADVNYTGKYSGLAWSFYTYIHTFRYNFYESSEDLSFSINAQPAIGISLFSISQSLGNPNQINSVPSDHVFGGGVGFMKFSLPFYLQANFGNIATRNSGEEKGYTAGIGFEYQLNPIFMITDESTTNVNISKSSFIIPSFNFGYVYYNDKNVPREVNFRLGLGAKDTFRGIDGQSISQSSYSFMISFHRYIGF